MGAFAGNTFFIGVTLAIAGALNGAGPDRREGFLCVCISDVTFFKSTTYRYRTDQGQFAS